ncbi:MAG: zinc ribbon domain-containing protein [Candidatus Aminicenantes bacterium]|nr:zinc ribbon domain-containing protein [Candidatus Aminicenantes bacterium]
MKCSNCNEELPERANFCFNCGFGIGSGMKKEEPVELNRREVALIDDYGGYLSVGGWINIISGAILAILLFNKASEGYRVDGVLIMLGFAGFISGLIFAWLYFGLHKVILKISRIEKTLESIKEDVVIKTVPGQG